MMKKLLVAVAACGLMAMATAADKHFQVGFWFNAPAEIASSTIDGGVSLGIPVSAGYRVRGAELSLIGSASEQMNGFQYAWLGFNSAKTLTGCQLAFVNFVNDDMTQNGFQVGFYNQSAAGGWQFGFINNNRNNAKFQLGLVNINTNGWLPVMVFVNFAK